jgi:hypothetical protein
VFTELSQITPEIVEALVVPFCSSIAPDVSGAIWIVSHDARQLTKRELAIMIDLANFTGPCNVRATKPRQPIARRTSFSPSYRMSFGDH